MNTHIVNSMLCSRLDTVFGGVMNPLLMSGMLPSLGVQVPQHGSYIPTTNYIARDGAFGSGFPEHTTVYPLLVADPPCVGYSALKNKIYLYGQYTTNSVYGLVVYREEVWSLILDKSVQAVLPFLEEWISKALNNMRTTLDDLVCLEDDDEEMVEWTIKNRKFMHYIINHTTKMAESLTCPSWDGRMCILELYADLKYYIELHKSSHYKQTSTSEEWNRGALLLLHWHRSLEITKARTPLMGWKSWGNDTSHHRYVDHLLSIIQNAYREVIEEENKNVLVGSTDIQNAINNFIQAQTERFKDDMLISCFKQVQSLTLTVNKLCEKLQIAGQVLSF